MGPSRSCWNGRTSALKPEEITSKATKVSCVYYQKKSAHTKKVCKLIVCSLYIYILFITLLNDPKLILLLTVKWFQVLVCITNNLIKHQSFTQTQLNDQIVPFQILQFNICSQFKCQTVLFDP